MLYDHAYPPPSHLHDMSCRKQFLGTTAINMPGSIAKDQVSDSSSVPCVYSSMEN